MLAAMNFGRDFQRPNSGIGHPSLLEYDDPASLFERCGEVWGRIAALTATWNRTALMDAMLARNIRCGEVKAHLEAQDDPHGRHLGAVQTMEHPAAGTVRVVGPAVCMGATPPAITRAPPLVGQQSQEFGFAEDEVAALLASGAIAQADHA